MSNLHVESLAVYYESAARWCYDVESNPDFYHLRTHYEGVCDLAMIAPHTGGIIERRALQRRELADALRKYSKPYSREKGWSCDGLKSAQALRYPVTPPDTRAVAEKMFEFLTP